MKKVLAYLWLIFISCCALCLFIASCVAGTKVTFLQGIYISAIVLFVCFVIYGAIILTERCLKIIKNNNSDQCKKVE